MVAAAELEVVDFRADPLNFKASEQGSPMRDMNANLCALIRIESDVAGRVDITGVTVYKTDVVSDGIIDHYIEYRERYITLTAQGGYMPYRYKFPKELEKGKVYILRVKSVGEDVKRILQAAEVRLKYRPEQGEEIYGGIDGGVNLLDFSAGELTLKPSPGAHTIRLNSRGRVWEKRYELAAGQKVEETVEFTSAKKEDWTIGKPGGLFIESEPMGAMVLLNQVEQGVTPLTLNKVQPGKYTIEIVKDLYLPDSRIVEVKSLEIPNILFKLVPNFGRIKITSVPSGANVSINDQLHGQTPLEIPRINAGVYSLRLTQNLYYDEADNFEIKPDGEFVKEYKLRPRFGKLTLTSDPPGAEVTVLGASWGKTPLTRDKVPSGEYQLRLTQTYFFDEEVTLRVVDGQTTERNIPLRPSIGRLSVTSDPPEADVIVVETKKSLGKTPIVDMPLDRGSYSLRVEKELYEPYETSVALIYGGSQSVEAKLHRSIGHIQVSTTPQKAKIFIGDQYRGDTPTVVKDIPTGIYKIRLEKDKYDIHIGQVEIKRNQVAEYVQTLGTAGTKEWLKRRSRARLISLAAPGGGQFLSRQYVRGAFYSGAFLGSVAMAYLATIDHDDAKKDYWNAVSSYHASTDQTTINARYRWVGSAEKKMKDAEDRYLLSLAAVGGAYALQLADAWLWGGSRKPVARQYSDNARLVPYADAGGKGIRVGLKVEF